MKGPKGKFAWTAKVGEKGQIVIPKEAREIFDISPGDTLLILGDIKRGLALVKGEKFAQLFEVFESEKGDGKDESDPDDGTDQNV